MSTSQAERKGTRRRVASWAQQRLSRQTSLKRPELTAVQAGSRSEVGTVVSPVREMLYTQALVPRNTMGRYTRVRA